MQCTELLVIYYIEDTVKSKLYRIRQNTLFFVPNSAKKIPGKSKIGDISKTTIEYIKDTAVLINEC